MLLPLRVQLLGAPAGIAQPGGPGTTIYVYDNARSANGLYYTIAEIQAAFPNDFQNMVGAVSGLTWGGIRKQYLSNVKVTWGGQSSDGSNPTTVQDTNVDVFFRSGGSWDYRIGGGLVTTKLGTKRGNPPSSLIPATMAGSDGCGIYQASGSLIFRGDWFVYGCSLLAPLNVQFLSTGGSQGEVAGNLMRCGISYTLGESTALGVFYNNILFSPTTGNVLAQIKCLDSGGNFVIGVTPQGILSFSAATPSSRIKNTRLVGAPTTADIRSLLTGDNSGLKFQGTIFTDTPGVPRFLFFDDKTPAQGAQVWREFNTKVVDASGNGVVDIPVRLITDVDGEVVDTKTFGDGDIGFLGPGSGFQNGVLVRDEYREGGVGKVRDRVFTLLVNIGGGSFPVNPAYPGKQVTFEWPGRDAPSLNGGRFVDVTIPVTLVSDPALPCPELPRIYERQPGPATPFVPQDGPNTQFSPQDIPEQAFAPGNPPGTAYTHIPPPATDLSHGTRPTTVYTHGPVPQVSYTEAPVPAPEPDEFIFGGIVMEDEGEG